MTRKQRDIKCGKDSNTSRQQPCRINRKLLDGRPVVPISIIWSAQFWNNLWAQRDEVPITSGADEGEVQQHIGFGRTFIWPDVGGRKAPRGGAPHRVGPAPARSNNCD